MDLRDRVYQPLIDFMCAIAIAVYFLVTGFFSRLNFACGKGGGVCDVVVNSFGQSSVKSVMQIAYNP